MLNLISNKKGLGMVEVIMAILLTSVAVLGVMSIQPTAVKTAARSDYLGRAAGLLYGQMQVLELAAMNPATVMTATSMTWTEDGFASGEASAIDGDAKFKITRTITKIGTDIWRITITVSWPPLNSTGITENVVVTRQDRYKY